MRTRDLSILASLRSSGGLQMGAKLVGQDVMAYHGAALCVTLSSMLEAIAEIDVDLIFELNSASSEVLLKSSMATLTVGMPKPLAGCEKLLGWRLAAVAHMARGLAALVHEPYGSVALACFCPHLAARVVVHTSWVGCVQNVSRQ